MKLKDFKLKLIKIKSMIFLPEIRLKKIVDSLFGYLRTDLTQNIQNGTENMSYLYLLFHEDAQDTNASVNYEEAKNIFLRKEDNPRYLKVRPAFDRQRAAMPTIHIVIPQDSESMLQIGDLQGELYEDDYSLTEKLERGYQTQFNLIASSDNINEVLLINYILRALLVGSIPQLQVVGFINPQFAVQDLNVNQELFPVNAYMKGILMTATYTETIPQVGKEGKTNVIVFDINKIKY